jgi:hypothetical protein
MGLPSSLVLVEGDHRLELDRLLAAVGYTPAVVPRHAATYDAMRKALFHWRVNDTVGKKAVACVNGFTVVADPDSALASDPAVCRELARRAHGRLVALIDDREAHIRGFTHIAEGAMRSRLFAAGDVVRDQGLPIDVERELTSAMDEADLVHVMERLAFPHEALLQSGPWQVLTLTTEDAGEEVEVGDGHASAAIDRRRRWWQLW